MTLRTSPTKGLGMRKSVVATALAPMVVLALAACGTSAQAPAGSGGGSGGGQEAVTGLRYMVPNTPGSGYDLTARTATKVMEDAGLARNVEVFNVPGAGGTVGLQRVVNEKGNGKLIMQMGLGVVGASYTNNSEATLKDTTPIAKLIEEPEAVLVPAASPYQSLDQLVTAWKADPRNVPVGGGSSPGGPDHLAPHLLAKAVGIDPKTVNYVAYDGGGELLTSLLGGQIAFGMSSASELIDQIQAGQVRVLAVTGAERTEGIDAPTLREANVDLEFTNWRGVVAPPGIGDADKQTLAKLIDDMHNSQEWKDAEAKNNFIDAYLPPDQFATFLQQENERVAGVLRELGLTQA
jgi:putative tricarboxylic transport membrane protein